MKRTINGKTYNTKTAINVGNGDNGLDISDGYRATVEIYRTPKGAYFLVDENSRIIAIQKNGKLTDGQSGQRYEYHNELTHINDILSIWCINFESKRETEYFNIVEA